MLICERGCMPDKPAVPRYISPLLPAVKPRGPTPSISRTCTLPGRCECVRALHYVTLPFRTRALSSFNENLEEHLVVSRGARNASDFSCRSPLHPPPFLSPCSLRVATPSLRVSLPRTFVSPVNSPPAVRRPLRLAVYESDKNEQARRLA